MSFEADDKHVYDLFTKRCYGTPRNQRQYVWNKRNWQELFDDVLLVATGKEATHFIGFIDRLKLRASFGYTGSQGFSSYDAMATFMYYNGSSYNGYIGSYVKGLANENLHWQEKYDSNIGLDFNFFKNRLSGRIACYVANTKGMITNVTVPGTTGFSTYVDNLGETQNKGIELYLNYRVFSANKGRDYINLFANMAHNKNKLKKISNSLRAWNDEQDKNMLKNNT